MSLWTQTLHSLERRVWVQLVHPWTQTTVPACLFDRMQASSLTLIAGWLGECFLLTISAAHSTTVHVALQKVGLKLHQHTVLSVKFLYSRILTILLSCSQSIICLNCLAISAWLHLPAYVHHSQHEYPMTPTSKHSHQTIYPSWYSPPRFDAGIHDHI